jgi:hypothetical protein
VFEARCFVCFIPAQAMLKDAGNCKTEDHDSEDEEAPEDEIDST